MLTIIGTEPDGKLKVRCECGRELLMTSNAYKLKGRKLLCGLCQPDGTEDLTGRKFGMLTVLERTVNSFSGYSQWICKCDCGNVVTRLTSTLMLEEYNHNCGCLNIPETPSPLKFRPYRIYRGMVERCTNPNHTSYPNYGGRGIKVCDRWLESFDNFWEDMREGYSDDLSLDRINNDGDYEPGNCRWATAKQQSRNQRTNRRITTAIGTKIVAEQAEIARVRRDRVYNRLNYGIPEELAITPVENLKKQDAINLQHLYNGETTIVSADEAKKMVEVMGMADVQAKAIKDWGIGPDEIILGDEHEVDGLKVAPLGENVLLKKE